MAMLDLNVTRATMTILGGMATLDAAIAAGEPVAFESRGRLTGLRADRRSAFDFDATRFVTSVPVRGVSSNFQGPEIVADVAEGGLEAYEALQADVPVEVSITGRVVAYAGLAGNAAAYELSIESVSAHRGLREPKGSQDREAVLAWRRNFDTHFPIDGRAPAH